MSKYTVVLILLVTHIYGRSITLEREYYDELLADYALMEANLAAAEAEYAKL